MGSSRSYKGAGKVAGAGETLPRASAPAKGMSSDMYPSDKPGKAPSKVPNRNFISSKIEKGRFQGMTVGELLEKATPDDVTEMLEWVTKNAPFNGGDWKVSVFYVTWAQVGAPK